MAIRMSIPLLVMVLVETSTVCGRAIAVTTKARASSRNKSSTGRNWAITAFFLANRKEDIFNVACPWVRL